MALLNAFILTYDRMRRYQGAWHLEKKLVFPANVLLESENENVLREEINRHKEISDGTRPVLRMTWEEEKFLSCLCGKKKHIEMSRGVICRGVMQVTEGPLEGMEERICQINRHKRLARIQASKSREAGYILAGLEIMEKSL